MAQRWLAGAFAFLMVLALFYSARAQDSSDAEATIAALQTQVATLQQQSSGGAASTPQPPAVVSNPPTESAEAVTTPTTVNVEIILDDSGSMGQIIDTGETRLEAAKRVLNQVLASVPNKSGINVGLRIYGHQGDNTDAGKDISCQSSDLIVPIKGINRDAIAQQIAPLVPTGWTPIARSLERAEADFPASDGTVARNAVVLLTDGLETCGGDPAAEAQQLASSEKKIATHVIGFALNPDEQQMLQGIASAGGGMLLGATNASELTAALFKILEKLNVVKGTGFVGGTAIAMAPKGEPGKLSIAATGEYDGTSLPVLIRNNTNNIVLRPSATGKALNPAGQMIATGGDQGFYPNLLEPGAISIGYIYFGGVDLQSDTTFQITLSGKQPSQQKFENIRDLNFIEAVYLDGRIVGTLKNGYDETLTGPFGVELACLDADGALLSTSQAFSQAQSVVPGEEIPFQVPSIGSIDCPNFLVAGRGFSNSFDSRHKATDILTPTPESSSENGSSAAPDSTAMESPQPPAPQIAEASPTAPSLTASKKASGCYDLSSAESIVVALQTQGLPIGQYIVYDEDDDPNELLGRPGGYIGKVNFQDSRLEPKSDNFDTGDGGSVEVFANEADLQKRISHLQSVWNSISLFRPDVLYSNGAVLLRVSSRLKTTESDEYGTTLKNLTACK